MRIEKAIRDYLIEIEVRTYTPKTIRSYRYNLSLFLHFIDKISKRIKIITRDTAERRPGQ